jgi:hypothetical protein
MVKFIEFWTIDQNGVTLYHQKANKNVQSVDQNLVSGFLSAFQSMLSVSAQDSIEAIKFRDSKLVLTRKKFDSTLFFIARSQLDDKDKVIRKELDKISELFISDFRSLLVDWTGDTSLFNGFENRMTPYW